MAAPSPGFLGIQPPCATQGLNEVKYTYLILVNDQEGYSLVGVAFIGMAAAFISALLLAYCGVFVCLLLGVALPHRPGAELQVSGL